MSLDVRLAAALVAALLLALPIAAEDTTSSDGRLGAAEIAAGVRSSMDPAADPCQDFYRYACGGWLDATTLPADQTRWARSFSVVAERNRVVVRAILEEAAREPGADADRRRIGHYYGACMDEPAIEAAGTKPLAPYLAEIEGVRDARTLAEVAGKLHRIGIDVLFAGAVIPDFERPDLDILFFFQSGLGMPDRDYYVSEDPKKRELLAGYRAHVATLLGLLGEDAATAARHADQVLALETELARVSKPRAEMRDPRNLYNKIDRPGLAALAPRFPWDVYFAALGHSTVTEISVASPEFFRTVDNLAAIASPEALQAYLRWHLVQDTADLLADRFVQAQFDFFGRALGGQQEIQPRWKRCVGATQGALGEAVGKLYVERMFGGPSKQIALEMIGDIEAAFAAALPELAWMDEATREAALGKARAVGDKIGYPDAWRDYSSLPVEPAAHFANGLAARVFEHDRQLRKVGQPTDRSEWAMTPQTVNASYNPLRNEITFPAGILQPPFFHRDFPAAMNYGGIGAVIGHELSHGFDDQGRKFAADGQLREWWAPEVVGRYEERAACVRDLYSTYEVEPGVHVLGELTLGENVADLGGVKQSYRAFQSWLDRHGTPAVVVEGLSPEQLFFVAYAQNWCSLATPEVERMLVTTDSHSPPRFRVVGPLSSFPAFGEAFSCPVGSPMRPKEVCEVW